MTDTGTLIALGGGAPEGGAPAGGAVGEGEGLPPLYCVHPVSGSAYGYARLAPLLGPGQPLYGFEAPGYDDGGTPLTTIDALARRHLDSLRAARPHGPYLLLGWSLGGVVAYHMAQLLAEEGESVPLLVLVDATVPRPEPLPPEKHLLHYFLRDLVRALGEPLDALDELVAPLPEDITPQQLWPLVEELDLDFDEDFLQERYDVFRAHTAALYTHEHRGAYDGQVLAVTAEGSDHERQRWETLAPHTRRHTIAGDHDSIWDGEGLTVLAGLVRQELGAVRR
ncbi:alpha/beta fold hydrolase [Streptomyces sp. NPDC046909]|uniref:thioesterase domain-containing protein n=1 Tax=Streptomyces sp. NPDC046909 TaxID=3155617 RepID=UPI0033D04E1C